MTELSTEHGYSGTLGESEAAPIAEISWREIPTPPWALAAESPITHTAAGEIAPPALQQVRPSDERAVRALTEVLEPLHALRHQNRPALRLVQRFCERVGVHSAVQDYELNDDTAMIRRIAHAVRGCVDPAVARNMLADEDPVLVDAAMGLVYGTQDWYRQNIDPPQGIPRQLPWDDGNTLRAA